MKLKVTQENLTRALAVVSRVAASRTTLPILSNILLKAEGNGLMLASTNLELAITVTLNGKVDEEGSITVPARLLTDFVGSLPAGNIDLSVDGQALLISAGKYTSKINGLAADEFPSLPDITDASEGVIDAHELKSALQQTVFAASSDEARQILTAVNIHSHQGGLFAVATDSYRLAERRISALESELTLLIPAGAMQEVLRAITDEVDEVHYSYDESQVRFSLGGVTILSRLIDGTYPDYRALIPREGETEFTIKKADFINITKVSSLFAKESAGSITLEVSEDEQQVSIRSIASQVGENTSIADAVVKGSGSVTLNSRYLASAEKPVHVF
jgi:DNA polymerase-3 subunit beta